MGFSDITNLSDKLISKVINEQSISDVTLGSFLSGGIDSSIVTAYLQRNSLKKFLHSMLVIMI